MMLKKLLSRWPLILFIVIITSFVVIKVSDWFYQPKGEIIVADNTYVVFVADTPKLQYAGWSDQSSMGKYDGMWFQFKRLNYHTLVMRRMNFPLDIIWLNQDEVVDMAPNVLPVPGVAETDLFHYRPRSMATDVLEMRAGFIEENQIKIGDKLILSR